MIRRLLPVLFVCASVSTAFGAEGSRSVIAKSHTGNPEIRSINVLSFAPHGVLLIGDGAGSQVVAVDTGDVDPASGVDVKLKLADIKKTVAGHIGASADGVELIDVAVNPASGKVYLAARKQNDKAPFIVTIDNSDEVRLFDLESVAYARIRLSSGDVKIAAITDVAWAEDRIIAAGRSNESFSSKIFSIPAPLKHDDVSAMYSAETYHVSHRKWETKAPMSVVIPFKEDDKTYVVGAFSCTPVVKYPIDAIQPGAEVKGSSMIELGSGNRPIDMFVYEKDGKQYVLSNTFRFHHERKPFGPSPYWTVKFEQSILGGDRVNENAVRRLQGDKPTTDAIQMVESYHGVMQMDKLGNSHAVVLRQTGDTVALEVLPLP
ncbi:MAG: hypothetical protein KDB14_08785 [Planctomycetales bacterium]|nr:hypothetical protein [Planctomycetales bacterium]